MLAACTQEEAPDGSYLPEGEYPVLITATRPATRVTDDGMNSSWSEGDRIGLCLRNDTTKKGIYTLHADGTVNMEESTPLYCKNPVGQELVAWYHPGQEGNSYGFNFSIAEQGQNLTYLMRATGTVTDIEQPVPLEFQHLLTKVRVRPDSIVEGMQVTLPSLYGTVAFNVREGTVTAMSGSETAIHMKRNGAVWEANVSSGSTISQVAVNSNVTTLANPISLTSEDRGKVYDINLRMRFVINLSKLTADYNINKEGIYIVTGTGTNGYRININVPATVILRDATITGNRGADDDCFGIKIACNGTANIKLEGNNTINIPANSWVGHGAIKLEGENTHLLLEGPGKLTAVASTSAVIGTGYAYLGSGICGNITIRNATLDLTNTNSGYGPGACIGTASNYYSYPQKCGDITIDNCDITCHTDDYPNTAVIGHGFLNGAPADIGSITIWLGGQSIDSFQNKLGNCSIKVEGSSGSPVIWI